MTVIERMATMYYKRGLWGKPELSNLVARGKLAEDAYRRITGEDYAEHDAVFELLKTANTAHTDN